MKARRLIVPEAPRRRGGVLRAAVWALCACLVLAAPFVAGEAAFATRVRAPIVAPGETPDPLTLIGLRSPGARLSGVLHALKQLKQGRPPRARARIRYQTPPGLAPPHERVLPRVRTPAPPAAPGEGEGAAPPIQGWSLGPPVAGGLAPPGGGGPESPLEGWSVVVFPPVAGPGGGSILIPPGGLIPPGWQPPGSIPEPGTWAMMVVGLAAVGALLRRCGSQARSRRSALAAAAARRP